MEKEPQSEKDVALLDKVAEATLSPDDSFAKVRALHEQGPTAGARLGYELQPDDPPRPPKSASDHDRTAVPAPPLKAYS